MKDSDALNKVAAFHSTFQHPIQTSPGIPSEQRCKLRVSLIAEELKEFEQAIKDKNIVEVADALCDLQYVLAGAILEFGLGEKFSELFEEVHRSNMSKVCKTIDEANLTVEHYKKIENTESFIENIEGRFLVFRKSDNKTLKSINYSVAELASILMDKR